MDIILTKHSYNRETNHKLLEKDIIIFIEKLLNDFNLEEEGFYKFEYDHIRAVLKKNNDKIKVITIYPKKKDFLELNFNFQIKKCIYQGKEEHERGKEELKINKSKTVQGGILIRLKNKKKKVRTKEKLKKDFIEMINNKNVELKRFRTNKKFSEISKKYFSENIYQKIRYILEPINEKYIFVYFLDSEQKLLKTLHINDFNKYKKELYEKRIGEQKQNDN